MTPSRRHAIRLMGGGLLLGILGTQTGCSSDYPPEAVAAWTGPAPDLGLREWALSYAILAPNSHNRQPWLVDLREPDAITLYVDRERLLPMTDPWFRQIMVSQGCFLELLVMALQARGVSPQVTLFPQGPMPERQLNDRPVARLHWPAGATGAQPDPLFAQVLRRQTAKVDYDTTRTVQADTLAALAPAMASHAVRYGSTVDPERVQVLRQLCLDSARVELLTPRTVMESVRLTRVGPREIAQHRDGISINGLLPRLADAVGAFDRSQPPQEGSAGYSTMMSRFEGHSRTAMGFVWLSTATADHRAAGTQRHAEVVAGRAYVRLQLQATALGLQVHPMSQAPQEFEEMRPHYERLHALLVQRPSEEETVQMFCRVGYAAAQPHTPRRALASFQRSA